MNDTPGREYGCGCFSWRFGKDTLHRNNFHAEEGTTPRKEWSGQEWGSPSIMLVTNSQIMHYRSGPCLFCSKTRKRTDGRVGPRFHEHCLLKLVDLPADLGAAEIDKLITPYPWTDNVLSTTVS